MFCLIANLEETNKYVPYLTDRGIDVLREITIIENEDIDITWCIDKNKNTESRPDEINHRITINIKNEINGPLC